MSAASKASISAANATELGSRNCDALVGSVEADEVAAKSDDAGGGSEVAGSGLDESSTAGRAPTSAAIG